MSFHPDVEVATDFAAVLSLLCRRLITVFGKASEQHSDSKHPLFVGRPYPMPLATVARRVAWRRHPLSMLYSLEGLSIRDYNPPPKPIDTDQLTAMLMALPDIEHAGSLVTSCRLYALALEVLHDRPEIAYQMLISSVEAIASSVLRTYEPVDQAKIDHKRNIYDLAMKSGLDEDAAREMAVAACRGDFWATRKFKKFLIDYVDESIWSKADEFFPGVSPVALPKRDALENVLGKIYGVRSKATHEGKPYPASATYTAGPNIDVRAAAMLYGTEGAVPPVVWFERLVNSALCSYWNRAIAAN